MPKGKRAASKSGQSKKAAQLKRDALGRFVSTQKKIKETSREIAKTSRTISKTARVLGKKSKGGDLGKEVTGAAKETKKQGRQIKRTARSLTRIIEAALPSKKAKTSRKTIPPQKQTKPKKRSATGKPSKRQKQTKAKRKNTTKPAKKRRVISRPTVSTKASTTSKKKSTSKSVPSKRKQSKQKQTPKKVVKKSAPKKLTPKKKSLAASSYEHVSIGDNLEVTRSYTLRAAPAEARKSLASTIEELQRDAPKLQGLLKDNERWAFRLNGGYSWQLFPTLEKLIARIKSYEIYRAFSNKTRKDFRDVFNTLEIMVVRFGGPGRTYDKGKADRQWRKNKLEEIGEKVEKRRSAKHELAMERREARKTKTKLKHIEEKRQREAERFRESESKRRLAEARAAAAERAARKAERELAKVRKGKKK